MTYATLMVHLELGESNAALLRVARHLAAQVGAAVIGVAASQPLQAVFGGSYATGDDAEQLRFVAEERNADVIVAGAYGHGRLREWILGGVTKNLLLRAERCSLMSH